MGTHPSKVHGKLDHKSTQPKEKESQQWAKNKEKKPYANMTQGYKMMINNNKEDLRWESCHLPQIG